MIPLELTAVVADAGIQKKFFDCRNNVDNCTQINARYHEKSKSLKESVLLEQGASETIENEAKEQRVDLLACY